jgi:hypothetical protein
MDRPEFHRLADRELNEAAQYYDLENPGLGSSFLEEVDRCLQSIEDHPEAGMILVVPFVVASSADSRTPCSTRSSRVVSGFSRS